MEPTPPPIIETTDPAPPPPTPPVPPLPPLVAMLPMAPEPSPAQRRATWLQIVAVIGVGVAPHYYSSIASLFFRSNSADHRLFSSVGGMAMSVGVLLAVLAFMQASGRGWAAFGIRRPRGLDVGLSVLVFVLHWIIAIGAGISVGMLQSIVPALGDMLTQVGRSNDYAADPSLGFSRLPTLLAISEIGVVAGIEEVVITGFLTVRLRDAFQSTTLGILTAASLMAGYHVYQGAYAVVIVLIMQSIVGFAFLSVGRLTPFVIAHILYDLVLFARYF